MLVLFNEFDCFLYALDLEFIRDQPDESKRQQCAPGLDDVQYPEVCQVLFVDTDKAIDGIAKHL